MDIVYCNLVEWKMKRSQLLALKRMFLLNQNTPNLEL